MAANRVLYAVESISLGNTSVASGAIPIHGLQTASLTTTFNLQQVFEFGQLDLYDQYENVPNVELTMEKILDGYPLIYHLASQTATDRTLLNRTNQFSSAVISIFSDAQSNASGVPSQQAFVSGLLINSISYSLPVASEIKETVTLVGQDKLWVNSGFFFNGQFNGTDSPAFGTLRRKDVVMGAAPTGSIWPTELPGMTAVNGSGYNLLTNNALGAHVQDVTITANLGRTDLFELGRNKQYFRYANFPVAIDTTINVTAAGAGDDINANSLSTSNVANQPLVIKLADGTVFDLGSKNKMQSTTFSFAPTQGGVATISYNYRNFNILNVTNPSTDPVGLS